MTAKDINAQTKAFAAVCQACALIQELANVGTWNDDAAAILIKSLASDSPDDLSAIYPEEYLKQGYFTLVRCFGSNASTEQKYLQLSKYAVLFLGLERRIAKSPTALAAIRRRLADNTASARERRLSVLDPALIENLSNIYKTEVSDVGLSRFNIYGRKSILRQPEIQHRIRALILTAIRAVVLWREAGGRRRSFIFRRSKLVECANNRLKQL